MQLDIASLGLGTFDFVNCIGVLHHLASPLAGLRCVGSRAASCPALTHCAAGRLGVLKAWWLNGCGGPVRRWRRVGRTLNTVLKPDGGMNLMVYGELGRRGIYDFQDMYRLLGVKREPALGGSPRAAAALVVIVCAAVHAAAVLPPPCRQCQAWQSQFPSAG